MKPCFAISSAGPQGRPGVPGRPGRRHPGGGEGPGVGRGGVQGGGDERRRVRGDVVRRQGDGAGGGAKVHLHAEVGQGGGGQPRQAGGKGHWAPNARHQVRKERLNKQGQMFIPRLRKCGIFSIFLFFATRLAN